MRCDGVANPAELVERRARCEENPRPASVMRELRSGLRFWPVVWSCLNVGIRRHPNCEAESDCSPRPIMAERDSAACAADPRRLADKVVALLRRPTPGLDSGGFAILTAALSVTIHFECACS